MVRSTTSIVSLAAFLLMFAAASAYAQRDRFWCGQRLIQAGMAVSEIVALCGEPTSVELVEEPIFVWSPAGGRTQAGVTVTEYWTYDRGSGRFPAKLTIREDVAERIELLHR